MPGPSADAIKAGGRRTVWTAGPTEVTPGVHATGAVPRRTDFEDVGGPFFLDAAVSRPDPIEDDQAVWIDGPTGVVVVLGCAHSGIVNTLDYVSQLAGGRSIVTVMGGTHLVGASAERLERTAAALERFGIESLGPSHCTGPEAMEFLRKRFPGSFLECGAGTRLAFEQ